MSKMLLDDQPLLVLPKLATKIGLNESIVVQQIHYWLLKKSNSRDGYYWVYNTSKDWVEQFPFWSESTVKRTLKSLEEKKLIVTGNYNKLQIDRTKWYRINYEELKKYDDTEVFDGRDRLGQIDTMDDSNWNDGQVNMTRPLPETTTKTTTDTKKPMLDKPSVTELDIELELEFNDFYKLYPKKVEKKRALISYKRVRKEYSEEHIINGLLNYIDWIKLNGTETKYIKGPAVYLNGENFNDEYDFSSVKKKENQSWGDIFDEIRTDDRNTGEIINTIPKTLGWG